MSTFPSNYNLPEIPLYFDDHATKEAFYANQRRLVIPKVSTPTANIIETKNSFQLELACPGFRKEDFVVRIESATLLIELDLENLKDPLPEQKTIYQEHHYQPFVRAFQLPFHEIDIPKTAAWYEAGLLHIYFPKKYNADSQIRMEIEVK